MQDLGAFNGTCDCCGGTGGFDMTDGRYMIPLNDAALDKGIEVGSGNAGLQAAYGRSGYSEAQAIYHQMGRNFAKFLERNVPKAYFDGVAEKLAELKGLDSKRR